MLVDDVGLWCEICRKDVGGGPALFLDRDGVVVEDTQYLGRAEDLRLLPGSPTAIGRCNQLGIPVVLVTNQSGIGRGYYDWSAFRAVQTALTDQLAAQGAHFDAVLACAYHEEGREPFRILNHSWRKPKPGMLYEAAKRMSLRLADSWIIGDHATDIEAGVAAKLAGGVLLSGEHPGVDSDLVQSLAPADFTVEVSIGLEPAVLSLLSVGHLRGVNAVIANRVRHY